MNDIALRTHCDATAEQAQKFFEALADSVRVPHAHEERKAWVKELLNRAQEANLYTPRSK